MISFYILKIAYLIAGVILSFFTYCSFRDYFGTYKTAKGDWLDLAFFVVTGSAAIGCFWMV